MMGMALASHGQEAMGDHAMAHHGLEAMSPARRTRMPSLDLTIGLTVRSHGNPLIAKVWLNRRSS